MSISVDSDPMLDRLRRRLMHIYDEYRTTILNRKYYGHRLKIAKRWDRGMDLVVALGSSGTIAGWAIWKKPGGDVLWTVIGGAVALIAILKSALPLPRLVERYSKLATGYGGLCFDIKQIIDQARIDQALPEDLWRMFRTGQARLKDLAAADDTAPSRRLIAAYFVEINREIPPDSLWLP